MNLGPTELLIVLAIVLLLFGSAKLPKLARSLGQASKEFRHGTEDSSAPDSAAGEATASPTAGPTGDAISSRRS